MKRHGQWLKLFGAALLATALAATGCGGDIPQTEGPNGSDAGHPAQDAGGSGNQDDGGEPQDDGGGNPGETIKTLNVVGAPSVRANFGEQLLLQAILIQTETGVISGETVTFTVVAGDASPTEATAVTDAAGIARTEISVGSVQGLVHVIALAPGVRDEDRADWSIYVQPPELVLERVGTYLPTLYDGESQTLTVKLSDILGRPVANGHVRFEASRAGLLIDGQQASSKEVTTSIQGLARINVAARAISASTGVVISASADYAGAVSFTLALEPKPPCYDDSECAASETCNLDTGICEARTGCQTDDDCNTGYVCTAAGDCVQTTSQGCESSADCDPGTYCNLDLDTPTCVIGCEDDTGCTEPQYCDLSSNRCVNPEAEGCADDSDCSPNEKCIYETCVPDPTNGTECTSTDDCEDGTYCLVSAGRCVAGCDSDSQCPNGACNMTTHQCVEAECWDDAECEQGEVCDLSTYQCVQGPPTIMDLSGDWENVVQVFHIANMLPDSIQNPLHAVDTGMQYAQAIIGGRVGDLLPSWVPGSIKDAISEAVAGSIDSYIPEWATQVVHIGSDVLDMVKNLEIHSTMSITQPRQGGQPNQFSVVDHWQKAVFYWYTNDCPRPAPGSEPEECAMVEIDLTDTADFPAGISSSFNGEVDQLRAVFEEHRLDFQYGKIVRKLLEMLLEYLTGYSSVQEALTGFVDCGAVSEWVRDLARDILPDSLDSAADMIDLEGTCTSALNSAAGQVTGAIDDLSTQVPIVMSGYAGITQDEGNESSSADHLVNGIWNGSFGGTSNASGQTLADWTADRSAY